MDLASDEAVSVSDLIFFRFIAKKRLAHFLVPSYPGRVLCVVLRRMIKDKNKIVRDNTIIDYLYKICHPPVCALIVNFKKKTFPALT